jgi:hypothetical protein
MSIGAERLRPEAMLGGVETAEDGGDGDFLLRRRDEDFCGRVKV